MLSQNKLYMLLVGCRPKGRLTEQHDIYFGIAPSLKSVVPQLKTFWPEAQGNLHIDAWREVLFVDGYKITVCEGVATEPQELDLFFINLGGYQQGSFDELHYKLLIVATNASEAVKKAKAAEFYKTAGFPGAVSHIDDKYEVDDLINVKELLPFEKFYLNIEKSDDAENTEDEIHLGYLNLSKLKE